MIEAQELANWQQHANWSQPWMVEQDYIISRAVALHFQGRFTDKDLGLLLNDTIRNGVAYPGA